MGVGFGGGGDTVTIVQHVNSGYDELGAALLDTVRTEIPGCRHRPMVPGSARGAGLARAEEEPEIGVSVGTSWWQTTLPLIPSTENAILALSSADTLEVGGISYKIIGGLHPFDDLTGKPAKVTLHTVVQSAG